ncbi:MAG: thioredoxin family protein [Bacteroidetes bacterium]|nr:thioredoxin family protein [Bacteroidota bacterium]
MLRKFSFVITLFLFSTGMLFAQTEKPQPANDVLQSAYKEAKSSDKNVFLFFHASWCGWCKRLEKAIQSPELKKIFEDNYVITHLDVLERKEKIDELENPGGREIMAKLGGEKSGIPFYVFLDDSGKKLADSNVMPENQNIGYPGSEEEIQAFGKLLKISAKHMNEEQFASVLDYLRKNAPKPASH